MRIPLRYVAILGFVGFVTSFGGHIVAVNLPSTRRLGLLAQALGLSTGFVICAGLGLLSLALIRPTRGNELPLQHGADSGSSPTASP